MQLFREYFHIYLTNIFAQLFMMSEFWLRKMRTFFKQHDFDGDGFITKKDFDEMAIRFCDREKVDSDRREMIRKHFDNLFRKFSQAAEAKKVDEAVLTETLFIESLQKQLRDPGVVKVIDALYRSLFQVMDVNEDGSLQVDEYQRFFENIGLSDTSFTKTAFEAIDVDGDGKLSFEEFVTASKEFLLSENESSPTLLMWGPLVK